MSEQPALIDESDRLARLRELRVLDSAPDRIFDALVKSAAEACGTPIALLSLVDADRLWFKAGVGLGDTSELPRDLAFCTYAVPGEAVMEVPDALLDQRFANHPLVTGGLGIRFYAAVQILLSDGFQPGSLCVIDTVPRQLSEEQRGCLCELAVAIAEALEFRAKALRAAEIIEASQARLEQLYRVTPAMLYSTTGQGRLLTVSDTWLEELGYRREEVLGRSIRDMLTPESRKHAGEVFADTLRRSGRFDNVELQMVCKDGRILDVQLTAVVEYDQDRQATRIVAVATNITERKLAEAASERAHAELEEATRRFRNTTQAAGVGLWSLDLATYAISWDETMYRLYGLDCAGPAVSSELWLSRLHPDDVDSMFATFTSVVEEGGDTEADVRAIWPDGSLHYLKGRGSIECDAAGRPRTLLGTMWDITEQRLAEQALRSSERFLERTGAIAGIGGLEVDLQTMKVSYTDQACRIFDLPCGRALEIDALRKFVTPDCRPLLEGVVREAEASGKPYSVEVSSVSAKGRPFWAQVSGSFEYENGKPVRLVGAIHDITQRREMERKLFESMEFLQVTLDSIGDAVITTDDLGKVKWLNPVGERLTGWKKADAYDRPIGEVFTILNEETRKPVEDPVSICLTQDRIVGLANHTLLISRDGTEYGVADSAAPIRDAAGKTLGVVLVFHDVSEQRRMSNEMSYRARHDTLTGLINRSEFEERLEGILLRARADGSANALMYIDLDQFKLVNDACGHSVGDQLLKQFGSLLRDCMRAGDTVARLGGDEFGVILEHCDIEQAHRIAQKICDRMEDFRFLHEGRRFWVGSSVGLVPLDGHWSVATALQAADTSCYAAKDAGRNRVHVWFDTDQAMNARQGEMQWVSRIEQALDEDRFELFAQRIVPVSGATEKLHCEILLRLREPDGAITNPGAFLPAAERFHKATRIDRWVLQQVFAWLGRLGGASERIEMVSVNLSGQSIVDRAFHRHVAEMIGRARFDVGKLCFEITETAAITNLSDAKAFIEEVRGLGVKIALDDFGAGASSFSYLKTMPVDFIKIDGQFITDLLEDELDNAAVRCFRDVARIVGVCTVAEFVEREEVRLALAEIGIDMAQGHLIHRAEPLDVLLKTVLAEPAHTASAGTTPQPATRHPAHS